MTTGVYNSLKALTLGLMQSQLHNQCLVLILLYILSKRHIVTLVLINIKMPPASDIFFF